MRTAPLPLRPALGCVGDPSTLDEPVRRAREALPVALVCMPFVSHLRPSIQIGLLKSIAASHGFPARTFHLNLDFAGLIGPTLYERLCDFGCVPVGDWLFSLAAFGNEAPDAPSGFLDHHRDDTVGLLDETGKTDQDLIRIRTDDVPRYLDWLLETVIWTNFKVVGFTSTFQQNVPSFALARRIKERFPSIKTVFGGANFEDEMGLELVRSLPWVDYAVIGEADLAFSELLIALAEDGDPGAVPGVAFRRNDGQVVQPRSRPLFEHMDELPTPDYGEFFQRASVLRVISSETAGHIRIPFESARGCWWGQRKHCTFCGLNGTGMTFRSKSPQRVRNELAELSRRYGIAAFSAVDNIMDASYFSQLLPELANDDTKYDLFYEVKSNLHRDHIRLLSEAGVRSVQPGIESFSTHILQLMKKGVTGIQNINTLRWCHYYGVEAAWNLLYGFPGETEEDYQQQFELISRISHLQPPESVARIWIERFSPIFNDQVLSSSRSRTPRAWYEWIYPSTIAIEKVAYFFDYDLENVPPLSAMLPTHNLVAAWRRAWREDPPPWLRFWVADDHVRIEDGRTPASVRVYEFGDPIASLYIRLSDRPATLDRVRRSLGMEAPRAELEGHLGYLCETGLMVRDGPLYLSLALPATSP